MKRRAFILLGALGAASVSLPLIKWLSMYSAEENVLAQPKLLSHLCGPRSIRLLGKAYLELKPDESDCERLVNELLGESSGEVILKRMDKPGLQARIESRIKKDFDNGMTIVLKGWILSVTEARQCALYSLLHS